MDIGERLDKLDWKAIEQALWEFGYAKTPAVLTSTECEQLVALYTDPTRFRRRIDMARYRFGVGEYQYFATPLPPLVQDLRTAAYPPLAALANSWMQALGVAERYPLALTDLLERCRRHGQTKPTPLLLRYEAGGYNCLHQDVYGEVVFPLQLTCFLSRPGIDYTGGEFLLVEQRPRAQSRGEAIATEQGEIIIFATRERPVAGARGYYRVKMRHGVSRVRSGLRFTLGIIFHDAA
ncbi:MAG TPA: 2OG-Fe(II) oxygenase [Alphaproteobacteria bacterium]|nr:2OG-Fe(II) oxygenase [Alphaproteobacteria bacterium]